jgi:hypothetical protein
MDQQHFRFWTCPHCIHVQGLNLEQMTNYCRLIDEGRSPVDGDAWEYHDHDICPAFEQNSQQAVLFADALLNRVPRNFS